jgi:hypothetical protein
MSEFDFTHADENLDFYQQRDHAVYIDGHPLKEDGQTRDRSQKSIRLKIFYGTSEMFYAKPHTLRKYIARLQLMYPHLLIERSALIKLETPKNEELEKKARLRTVRRMVTQTGNKLIKYEQGAIAEVHDDIFGKETLAKFLNDEKYIAYQHKHINYIIELQELESTE